MDSYLLHPLGKVTLEDGDLVSRIDPKRGMLGHKQADESRFSAMSVHSVCLVGSDTATADVVFGTAEGMVGFRKCKRSITRVDAQTHHLIDEFILTLQGINPSIEVSYAASTTGLGEIKWAEHGAKLGFFKSALADARDVAEVQKARKASEPQVQVKRYKDAKEYEKDARKMLGAGWRMEGQSGGRGRVNMGRTVLKAGVLLPWAVMRPSRKGDPITVTWLQGGQLEEIEHPEGINETSAPEIEPKPDITETLRKLAELRDAGVLSPQEFDAKKAELLARI
jgi:Short C-terminal domain